MILISIFETEYQLCFFTVLDIMLITFKKRQIQNLAKATVTTNLNT